MTSADDKRLRDQVNAANNPGAEGFSGVAPEDQWRSKPGWYGAPQADDTPPELPANSQQLPDLKLTPPDTRSEVETLAEVLGDIRVEQARQEDWWTSDEDHTLLARVLRGECAAWAPGVLAAGYVSPARHDADIAAAKAAGAAEVVAQVEAVLAGDALWSPLKKALNKPEHAGATLNSIYAPGVILDALATLLVAELRAALTTGGEGRG